MHYSGYHIMIDVFGCMFEQLEDVEYLTRVFEKLIANMNTNIVAKTYHKFEPQGLSMAFIISASHITIHTWPENNYAGIDIFTCSKSFNKDMLISYIKSNIICSKVMSWEIYRGQSYESLNINKII